MPRARGCWLIGSLAAITAACTNPAGSDASGLESEKLRWANLGKTCASDSPAYSLAEDKRTRLFKSEVRTIDTEWAEVAQQVPGGWGGFFLAGGRSTIYLQDPSQKDAAVEALARLLPELARRFSNFSNIDVRQGRWNFSQLYDWYRYLAPHAWGVDGVTQSDIQEANNRIEYGVADESDRPRLEQALQPLDLPCYLVAIGISPPVSIRGMARAGD